MRTNAELMRYAIENSLLDANSASSTGYGGAIYFPNIKVNAPHLGDRLESIGKTWKAYEQGMGTPCNLNKNDDSYYAPDDLPFINFTDISGNASRTSTLLRLYR